MKMGGEDQHGEGGGGGIMTLQIKFGVSLYSCWKQTGCQTGILFSFSQLINRGFRHYPSDIYSDSAYLIAAKN